MAEPPASDGPPVLDFRHVRPKSLRDMRIAELTRQIDRASVLLGLQRLSPDGYARAVSKWKEERARLEVERAREESARR